MAVQTRMPYHVHARGVLTMAAECCARIQFVANASALWQRGSWDVKTLLSWAASSSVRINRIVYELPATVQKVDSEREMIGCCKSIAVTQ